MKTLFTCCFLLISFNIFSQVDLSNGLIVYLPFTGNANDASGNNLHGTVHGAVLTTDKDGIANSAYYFDSNNGDYIDIPENALLRPTTVSVSAWVNPEENNIFYPVVYKGTVVDTTSFMYATLLSEDGSNASLLGAVRTESECDQFINEAEPYLDENVSIGFDSWHHVAMTYDGTELKVYFDGVLQNTFSGSAADITSCSGGGLNIGTCPAVIDISGTETLIQWFYLGKIDEVRVYNRALNLAEVQALSGVTTGLSFISVNESFKVYPNPSFTGVYNIESSINLSNPVFSVKDLSGKEVLCNVTTMNNSYGIDLSDSPKGVYWLQVQDGDKLATIKLIH